MVETAVVCGSDTRQACDVDYDVVRIAAPIRYFLQAIRPMRCGAWAKGHWDAAKAWAGGAAAITTFTVGDARLTGHTAPFGRRRTAFGRRVAAICAAGGFVCHRALHAGAGRANALSGNLRAISVNRAR